MNPLSELVHVEYVCVRERHLKLLNLFSFLFLGSLPVIDFS